jgi:hypothetical protein
LGLLPTDIFEADQEFGAMLLQNRPDIYNGYRAWAEIVVSWMEGKGPDMMPWNSDKEQNMSKLQQWAINWAKDIATPWAEEIAYRAGKRNESNITGKVLFYIGVPICKVVGVWQKVFGPSKKPAGWIKGASLIILFTILKAIVSIGNKLK